MEDFVVSARKYRPETFDTVVGQSHITTTLKNAIRTNQLAQSFLFCGPRGVGKTTCARILARTINCTNPTPEMEACGHCESCVSMKQANSYSIYELDAASNNSVDDIRALVDQVRIPPMDGKYKIYIIDEVHMLSTSAFNAFLKTLEEPPVYAKFILATTEKHKIIPTILSRCQIFDFKRITVDDMANHLEMIANKEEVKYEKDALHVIAQKADGALRDALSMFDQLVSFTSGNLTYKGVIENLHVLDYDYYFKIIDNFLAADIPNSLLLFNEIMENGFDGQHFLTGMAEHLRNLLVTKDPATVSLLEVSESIKQKYLTQSTACSIHFLVKALEIINQCDINYKASNNKRLSIEIALMQLSSLTSGTPDEKKNDIPIAPAGTIANITENNKKEEINAAPNSVAPNTTAPTTNNETAKSVAPPPLPTPQPPAEEEKIVKVSSLRSIAPSIKDMAAQQKKQLQSEKDMLLLKKTITPENFEKTLTKYIELIEKSITSLFSVMNSHRPVLKNEIEIYAEVPNKMNENEYLTHKSDILNFFRNELENHHLYLTVVVNSTLKEDIIYTPQDKLGKMSDINPVIQLMKKELDLDIDF